MIIHTVSRGETIFSIAEKYGVSAEILAFNNNIGLQNTISRVRFTGVLTGKTPKI